MSASQYVGNSLQIEFVLGVGNGKKPRIRVDGDGAEANPKSLKFSVGKVVEIKKCKPIGWLQLLR